MGRAAPNRSEFGRAFATSSEGGAAVGRSTRRRFLEDSLWAAVAATSMPAWAATGRAASARLRRVSPNEQIRVAVIGVNGRGKSSHLSEFARMDDVVVVAICDVDANTYEPARKVVESRGKKAPAFVQDLRRIMDDKSIDAVSIATTNHWHSLAGIWAMQSGKDVYIEKPVSHNVWEGRQLVAAARKYNRICQAGTQCRSNPGTREAIQYIHAGHIGKVRVARGLCYKLRKSIGTLADGAPPPGVDYNLWLGPAPDRAFNPNRFHYNWHWHWDYGNGDLGNQGIHQMDVARWGLNRGTLPKAVVGLGGRFGYQDQGETPNTHVSLFDYGDSTLIFEVRGLDTEALKARPSDSRGVKIGNIFYGTGGYVILSSYTSGAAFDLDGNLVEKFEGGSDQLHFRNFIDAMRSRKPSDLNGEVLEGHLSSALCHLGNISYRLGRPQPFDSRTKAFGDDREAYETLARFEEHLGENGVPVAGNSYRLGRKLVIDPAKETCGADEEANRLLTRDYRPPFVVPDQR
jgi:predicted dehydrogenase